MFLSHIVQEYLLVGVVAFLVSVTVAWLACKIFPRLKLMDRPHKYGLSRKPIPYYGGLAIFVSFVISVLLFVPLTLPVIGFLLSGALIVGVGFVDDWRHVAPGWRLFAHALAGVGLVCSGIGILSVNFPFLGTFDFTAVMWRGVYVLGAIFTVVWIMMFVNSMNFLDGVSGLTSGVTFVAGLTLFALSVHPGIHEDPLSQLYVARLALIIAAVALGFLIFDFPPAKILMGDTGSTFLGFVLGTLAIFSGGKVATAFLVLGLPILDMIWAVIRRSLQGRKFWQGDLEHLHHRLLERGLSPRRMVVLYHSITGVFGFLAISLVSARQKFFILIGLLLLMFLLVSALIYIPRKK